ncbi:MAG TPA: TSUP family transporter [Tepidisphaeraceae bacterium]|nr:TSUP family transporter [Tepidisphaeraceae bacterium]
MTALAMDGIPGRGSEAALGLLLPLLVVGDFIAVYQYRHLFSFGGARRPVLVAAGSGAGDESERTQSPDAFGVIRALLPGTAVGVVLGGLLLWWFHQQKDLVNALMRIEIGFESILMVGIHWWRLYKGVQQRLMREPWRSGLTGGFAAVSSTLAHAAGPVIAMYLLPLRLDRQVFVGASAVYFFMLNTAKLPAYFFAGQFAKAEVPFTLCFVPLVLGGALFGFWVNKHLSDKLFTKIVYSITFLMGWYILIDGTLKLLKH